MFKALKFASRLRDLRTRDGLTQAALAEKSGISHSAISKYETGQMAPTAWAICAFCKVFDVSADYLIGRTDTP